jgi:hypothetical protein
VTTQEAAVATLTHYWPHLMTWSVFVAALAYAVGYRIGVLCERDRHRPTSGGSRCHNTLPSGRPACMALPLDGCPCNEPARNAGEVGR